MAGNRSAPNVAVQIAPSVLAVRAGTARAQPRVRAQRRQPRRLVRQRGGLGVCASLRRARASSSVRRAKQAGTRCAPVTRPLLEAEVKPASVATLSARAMRQGGSPRTAAGREEGPARVDVANAGTHACAVCVVCRRVVRLRELVHNVCLSLCVLQAVPRPEPAHAPCSRGLPSGSQTSSHQ